MKVIELDLTGCKYLGEIHKRIKESFDFPDWYGENWSAFWDLLWSECDADKVIIKGEHSLSEELVMFLPKILNITPMCLTIKYIGIIFPIKPMTKASK